VSGLPKNKNVDEGKLLDEAIEKPKDIVEPVGLRFLDDWGERTHVTTYTVRSMTQRPVLKDVLRTLDFELFGPHNGRVYDGENFTLAGCPDPE
jgi:hypothetical protein